MKDIHRSNLRLQWIARRFQQILLSTVLLLTSATAQAQVTPDGTLGAERSNVVPRVLGGESIGGGAIRGNNLFHSFSEFNVGDQQRVYFANPSGVQNILTRVTGSTVSNINGTLGVDGTANLFLLNPNGIIFGQNARLDVRGSFVGSTANGIGFGNQGEFSTTNPQAPSPLLTIQPSALLFRQIPGGDIVNQAQSSDRTGLSVPTGKSLLLVGGNVVFEGGQITVPGGRIELGGLAEPGTVALSSNSDRFQLSFPEGVRRADLSLENGLIANTGGLDDIVLTGRDIDTIFTEISPVLIEGKSTAQKAGNLILNATNRIVVGGTLYGNPFEPAIVKDIGGGNLTAKDIFLGFATIGGNAARDISLNASDTITLSLSSIQAGKNPQTGQATGNLAISARNLSLLGFSRIFTEGTTTGNVGNISFNIADTLSISGFSTIQTDGTKAGVGSLGRSGEVNIRAGTLSIAALSGIASLSQNISGGNIRIAANTIQNNGGVIISNTVGQAPGANLDIQAGSVALVSAELVSSSQGQGNSGQILLNVAGATTLDRSSITSSSQRSGNGGDTTIQTGSLSLLDSAIFSGSTGTGNSGNLKITASDAIELRNTGTRAVRLPDGQALLGSTISTAALGAAKAGKLTLNTGRLSVLDGSFVNSVATKGGQAGDIDIQATGLVEVAGISPNPALVRRFFPELSFLNSQISAAAADNSVAGNLSIDTPTLSVRDNGSINTFSIRSNANAGTIKIRSRDVMLLNNGSIQSGSGDPGQLRFGDINIDLTRQASGGNIEINTDRLSVLNGSQINLAAFNNGDGGNLTVNALDSIDVSGSTLVQAPDGTPTTFTSALASQTAGAGKGGQITLNTRRLRVRDSGSISTETFLTSSGQGGSIQVNAADSVEVSGGNEQSSGIRASSFGTGSAGNVQIRTRRLALQNNGDISTNAFNSNAESKGGEITVNANTLDAIDGGSIIAATSSRGSAGNILLNVSDRIRLQGVNQNQIGSGVFATSIGEGKGGNLVINTGQLEVLDRALVSVSATGSGKGGDMTVNAPLVRLRNQGALTALSTSTDGGNITINADRAVVLRQNSTITTNAGTLERGGNGGNITIKGGFLVSKLNENNTIQANAFTGRGGNVSIAAQGIFGIQPASRLIPGLSTITASSQLGVQGNISITQPEVQPTQGVIELPTEPIDASNQIAQVCPRGIAGKQIGRFVNSGRGSLPPSPIEPLTGSTAVSLAAIEGAPTTTTATLPPTEPQIVEAQGWIRENGKVRLVAAASPGTSSASAVCPTPHGN